MTMTKKTNKHIGKTILKSGIATAIILSALSLQTVHAIEAKKAVTVEPGKGLSFKVGSKKAITYFIKSGDYCDVTIMLSEQNPVIGQTYQSASKVKVQLVPGKSTLVESADGKALKVACNQGAKTMTIQNQKVEISALTQ